jgi:DNA modification methylase
MPFSDEEFNDLLASVLEDVNSMNEMPNVEEDNFDTTPPPVPVSKSHDLYEMISGGISHRLYCGDSTNPTDVAFLMNGKKADLLHTDPPYNIKYIEFETNRGGEGKDWHDTDDITWNDDMSDEDYSQFLIDFLNNAKQHLTDWAHYYIWHATTYYREVIKALEINNIPFDKVPIQWVKQVAPLSWVRYKRKSEPCVFAGKGAVNGAGEGARWFGPHNEVNIWEIDRDHNVNYVHPTQKPLALAARAIRNSSRAGESVLDLFMGSGTTLITSDMMARNSFGMEMEPKFCDVIVTRYANYKISKSQDFQILRNGEDCTDEIRAMLIDSKKIVEKEIAQEA